MNRQKETGTALKWLSSGAGNIKWEMRLLVVIQCVLGISGVFYAMILRKMVNGAVDGNSGEFFFSAFLFAGTALFQIGLRAANRFLEEHTRAALENRFKKKLFHELLSRNYASVTQIHSGEWMNRMTSDTVIVADGLAKILPGISGMAVKIAGALAAILYLEPQFVIFLVPGGLLLVFLSYCFRKVLKKLHKKIQESDGKLRIFLSERLENLMIVRTFSREPQSEEMADQLMGNHRWARMRRNHFSNICNVGFGTAMNGAYVLGAVVCGYGILKGTMSYGNLLAMLQLISQIQNPFANITGFLPKYYAMLASAERLMEVEKFPPDLKEKALTQKEVKDFYQTDFLGMGLRDASFTYLSPVGDGNVEMPVVLDHVNLEIRKGDYVAITGYSGCGKSTVLKLLMCMYPLNHGERYLLTKNGERPLCSSMRGLFVYVPQGNQLMSGTIREILCFGDSAGMQDEKKLKQALEIACAWEFVAELEHGMDTILGERGTGLSEGQMQRIAIARAVFSGQPILLFDEATSSLDEETESRLLKNLRAMTDKTVVIVTHRPAVLEITDKTIDFSKIN